MTRRARIVCTLGPATRTPEAIRSLVEAGMDVARLNASHGTHDDHAALHAAVRQAADATGRAIAVMVDLQGPRIRLGTFEGGSARLERGAEFVLTTAPVRGTSGRAATTYADLARDVKPGDAVLIDDGLVRLEVIGVTGGEVRCRVVEAGVVSDHKGINLPGVAVSAPALTAKDLDDLAFALALGVDLVALSFVRAPEDAAAVRRAMDAAGARLPVIAKLEKPEAVARLEEIVEAFDGLMVARGDLGVEMPLEDVPFTQKRAIRLARERSKPVIVATQMLESMITHSRPTRAEASDVANAVLDGADALMLSGETAVGAYPLEAVRTMGRVIAAAEAHGLASPPRPEEAPREAQDAIARAAARVAHDLGACALVAFTESGATARRLASQREGIPLLAFTTQPAVRRQLALSWGVETFVVPRVSHTDEMISGMERAMLELGRGARGDRVVVVAGSPPGTVGSTNLIRVLTLGAAGASPGSAVR
jgi:pyruvate kinase